MRFRDKSVTPIRVGLDQIGIVGLGDALKATDDLDPNDREGVVDRLVGTLRPLNYIPDGQLAEYRVAFWREFLRHRGRDLSSWYSELPVTVRGRPGHERDRLVDLVTAVLATHELRPTFRFAVGEGRLELVIGDEVVARGPQNRASLDKAVRRTLSHW